MIEDTILVSVREYGRQGPWEQRRLTPAQFEELKGKISVTEWEWDDETAVSAEIFGTLREFRQAVVSVKKG